MSSTALSSCKGRRTRSHGTAYTARRSRASRGSGHGGGGAHQWSQRPQYNTSVSEHKDIARLPVPATNPAPASLRPRTRLPFQRLSGYEVANPPSRIAEHLLLRWGGALAPRCGLVDALRQERGGDTGDSPADKNTCATRVPVSGSSFSNAPDPSPSSALASVASIATTKGERVGLGDFRCVGSQTK